MKNKSFYRELILGFLVFPFSVFSAVPGIIDLELYDSLTKDGITWRFENPVRAGKFITGDWYIIGPAKIVSINPPPTTTPGRNGSVLNLPVDNWQVSPFDDRVMANRYTPSIRANPPISVKAGDALISSISVETYGVMPPWLRPEEHSDDSPVRSISILTCLAAPVATDAFRPGYCDRTQKLYYAGTLRKSLLPALAKVGNEPDILEFASHFSHPWLEVCFFHFDVAMEWQPLYERELGRVVGMAALMLMENYPQKEKDSLMIGFVQYGIDLWGIARAGYRGWPGFGGHGTGRKLPLVLSGLLLGDSAMANPNKTIPNLQFGEDMQTMYGPCWTGANVVYTGHMGVWNGVPVSSDPSWGPYEHLQPSQWPLSNGVAIGEDYRRCCTSIAWVGEALAAHIMAAESLWNHPAFFDYVDRWMTEDDSIAIKTIKAQTGFDYSGDWQRQKQCWDAYVQTMWAKYRNFKTSKLPHQPNHAPFIQKGNIRNHSSLYLHSNEGPDKATLYNIRGQSITGLQSAPAVFISSSSMKNIQHPVPAF